MSSPVDSRVSRLEDENARLRLELQAARSVPPLPIVVGGHAPPTALSFVAPRASSRPSRVGRKRGGKKKAPAPCAVGGEDFGVLCLRYKSRYEKLRARYKQAVKLGCPLRDCAFPDYVHCEVQTDLEAVFARLEDAGRLIDAALAVVHARQEPPLLGAEFPVLPRSKGGRRRDTQVLAPTAAVDVSQDLWGGLVQGLGKKKWGEYAAD